MTTPAGRAPQRPGLIVAGLAVLTATVTATWALTGSSNALWVCWLGLFAVFEAHGILSEAPGDTLSERLHAWFRLKTPAGRAGFFVVLGTLFAWLAWHLVELRPI